MAYVEGPQHGLPFGEASLMILDGVSSAPGSGHVIAWLALSRKSWSASVAFSLKQSISKQSAYPTPGAAAVSERSSLAPRPRNASLAGSCDTTSDVIVVPMSVGA
eukprot:scaffold43663_cov32-Tisochrysis_lutea.AAC.3